MRKVGFALDERLLNLHKERDKSVNFSKAFTDFIFKVSSEEVGTTIALSNWGPSKVGRAGRHGDLDRFYAVGTVGVNISHEAHERVLKLSSQMRKTKSIVLRAIFHLFYKGGYETFISQRRKYQS